MSFRLRSLGPLILMTSLLGAPSSHAARIVSPATVALQTKDLPRGFVQVTVHVYTNPQAARLDHVRVATLNRHGRLLSYRSVFRQPHPRGVIRVVDIIAAFTSSRGAQWDYSRVVTDARRSARRHRQYHQVAAPRVGRASTVFSFTGSVSRHGTVVDTIRFYDRRYRVTVEVTGVARTMKSASLLSYSLHLAQMVDRRIRHAP